MYTVDVKMFVCSTKTKCFALLARLLHSDRDPIPDVPAIYFVMPTEENIDRICQVSNEAKNVRSRSLLCYVLTNLCGPDVY